MVGWRCFPQERVLLHQCQHQPNPTRQARLKLPRSCLIGIGQWWVGFASWALPETVRVGAAWLRCFECYLYCCVRCCGLASSLFVLADNGNCCFILLIIFLTAFFFSALSLVDLGLMLGVGCDTCTASSTRVICLLPTSPNCFASSFWLWHFCIDIRTGELERLGDGWTNLD